MDVDFHVEHTSSDEYLIIILYIIPADNFLYRKIIWHYFLGGQSVLYQTMVWVYGFLIIFINTYIHWLPLPSIQGILAPWE